MASEERKNKQKKANSRVTWIKIEIDKDRYLNLSDRGPVSERSGEEKVDGNC